MMNKKYSVREILTIMAGCLVMYLIVGAVSVATLLWMPTS